jgi:hypothetical protein
LWSSVAISDRPENVASESAPIVILTDNVGEYFSANQPLHLLPTPRPFPCVRRPGMVGLIVLSSLAMGDRIKLLKQENERKLARFLEALSAGVLFMMPTGRSIMPIR